MSKPRVGAPSGVRRPVGHWLSCSDLKRGRQTPFVCWLLGLSFGGVRCCFGRRGERTRRKHSVSHLPVNLKCLQQSWLPASFSGESLSFAFSLQRQLLRKSLLFNISWLWSKSWEPGIKGFSTVRNFRQWERSCHSHWGLLSISRVLCFHPDSS